MSGLSIFSRVVEDGFCVGCGACAALFPDFVDIKLNDNGFYQAELKEEVILSKETTEFIEKICPFSNSAFNEDELSIKLFSNECGYSNKIGFYRRCFVGAVNDSRLYENSSSGGIARWILKTLLQTNQVDAIIHVKTVAAARHGDTLYRYTISTDLEEVENTGKSAYYPVEMSEVIQEVKNTDGRFAIIGLPCFIKTLRNISLLDPNFGRKIVFALGVVCGHLKSTNYAEMLGWQMGIKPENLKYIDFRKKIPGKKANEKGVEVASLDTRYEIEKQDIVQNLFGTDYGLGFFKYKCCDYCDDVVAETADISIGDAWLPQYMENGNSILVVRSKKILEILLEYKEKNELCLNEISSADVEKSQDAGLRHRRDGLAYRLHLDMKNHLWVPDKRVKPGAEGLSFRERSIHKIRIKARNNSVFYFKKAKKLKEWEEFEKPMRRLEALYVCFYGSMKTRFFRFVMYFLHVDFRKAEIYVKKLCFWK